MATRLSDSIVSYGKGKGKKAQKMELYEVKCEERIKELEAQIKLYKKDDRDPMRLVLQKRKLA